MKNKVIVTGDIAEIHMSWKGEKYIAIVDSNDLDKIDVGDVTWRCNKSKSGDMYAVASKRLGRVEGRSIRKVYKMHRIVTNAPDNLVVDHINHNTLDNRKSNLRLLTVGQNTQNMNRVNASSGCRGITFNKSSNKWQVAMKVNGKNHYLGVFKNLEDAERVAIRFREQQMPFSYEAYLKCKEDAS